MIAFVLWTFSSHHQFLSCLLLSSPLLSYHLISEVVDDDGASSWQLSKSGHGCAVAVSGRVSGRVRGGCT